MPIENLPIDAITADESVQSRQELHMPTVEDYTHLLYDNVIFPPVDVFFEENADTYWLADGFHRYWSAVRADRKQIAANVMPGGKRAAILHSIASNHLHGLRRNFEDKRKAVSMLLNDPEWSHWSDREIARRCGVSAPFVSKSREILTVNVYSENPETPERTYTNKHGGTSKMNTERIGKARSDEDQPRGKAEIAPVKSIQKPAHVDDVTPPNFASPVLDEEEAAITLEIPISGPLADNERDYWPELDQGSLLEFSPEVTIRQLNQSAKAQAAHITYLAEALDKEKANHQIEVSKLRRELDTADYFRAEFEKVAFRANKEQERAEIRAEKMEQSMREAEADLSAALEQVSTLERLVDELRRKVTQPAINPAKYTPTTDLLIAEGKARIQAIETIAEGTPSHVEMMDFVRVRDLFICGDLAQLPQVVENLRVLHRLANDTFGPKTSSGIANRLMQQFAEFTPFPAPHARMHAQDAPAPVRACAHDAPMPALSNSSVPTEEVIKSREGKSARKPKSAITGMPADFTLTDEMREYALSRNPRMRVDDQFELFVAHHTAKGSKFQDWAKAWQTWVLRSPEFTSNAPAPRPSAPTNVGAAEPPAARPALTLVDDEPRLKSEYLDVLDAAAEPLLKLLTSDDRERRIKAKIPQLEADPTHGPRYARMITETKRQHAEMFVGRDLAVQTVGTFEEWRAARNQSQSKSA